MNERNPTFEIPEIQSVPEPAPEKGLPRDMFDMGVDAFLDEQEKIDKQKKPPEPVH